VGSLEENHRAKGIHFEVLAKGGKRSGYERAEMVVDT
jgi:hypothetical protein